MSKLSTLAWLRCTTCVGHLGWLFKLNLHPRHQHCTDEAQKAETVLSAVSYIYIYIEEGRKSEGVLVIYLAIFKFREKVVTPLINN